MTKTPAAASSACRRRSRQRVLVAVWLGEHDPRWRWAQAGARSRARGEACVERPSASARGSSPAGRVHRAAASRCSSARARRSEPRRRAPAPARQRSPEHPPSGGELAGRDPGQAAADAPIRQPHSKSAAAGPDRRAPDLGVQVVREGVRPEQHLGAGAPRGHSRASAHQERNVESASRGNARCRATPPARFTAALPATSATRFVVPGRWDASRNHTGSQPSTSASAVGPRAVA